MMMKSGFWVMFSLLVPLAAAPGAKGAIFFGGSYGWLENNVYKTVPVVESPYLGGGGASYEAGFDIGSLSLSAELGPSYNQPLRHITASQSIGLSGAGKYKLLLGNLRYRLEPIESVQPYILLGGGQGEFTLDYGNGIIVGGRRIKTEKLKSWVVEAGFGFESPIRSWLVGGVRARFLYNRWQPKTDANRYPRYESGNAYSVDATLKIRI